MSPSVTVVYHWIALSSSLSRSDEWYFSSYFRHVHFFGNVITHIEIPKPKKKSPNNRTPSLIYWIRTKTPHEFRKKKRRIFPTWCLVLVFRSTLHTKTLHLPRSHLCGSVPFSHFFVAQIKDFSRQDTWIIEALEGTLFRDYLLG